MKPQDQHLDDELIDLGSVIAETKGVGIKQQDADTHPRLSMTINDD